MMIDTLWYTRCPVPTASGIAISQGWIADEFADDGINVRSLASSTEPRVRASHYLLTGTHLIRHGGSSPVFNAAARGIDIRVLAVAQHQVSFPIVALKDGAVSSPADLKGARLGVPRRTNDSVDFWRNTTLRIYDRALAAAGLSFADVVVVDLPDERPGLKDEAPVTTRTGSLWGPDSAVGHQRREVAALLRGEVDVIASEGSYAATVIPVVDAQVIFDAGRDLDNPERANNDSPTVLTVDGELLDARPDLVDRWLVQVLRAADWAQAHELEAKRLAALEVGLPEESIDTYFSPHLHDELSITLDPDVLAGLQDFGDHLHRHQRIAAAVNLHDLIDPGPLNRAAATWSA